MWAKVEGYPRWPATVMGVSDCKASKERLYLVSFVGERSHARLPADKIIPYREGYDTYARRATKNLRKAIGIANEIQAGNTTRQGTLA